jgi:hypothetical protein
MGIRRRRKKLTTIITSVDRRLRSVEYRNVPTKIAAKSITTEQITDGTIPPSDPKDSGATGAIASDTSPAEFAIITAATYSARNITGTNDRVDITTATDHGLSVGDKVTIYGLNNNDVNLDGNYTITEVPTSTTLRFSRGLTGFYQSAINMTVSGTVSSRYSTTTTATLTLNTTSHGFVVGDVITVANVPDDTFFNGTFKVSAVSGADISYNFASTQTAVSITSSTGSVKSVLHKYVIIGDTWIDTSVTPNVVKVWDGLTWTNPASLPEGIIVNDNMAPKAPTNLSAITSGYYNPTSGQPAVAVTLSWDAPTQNADDSSLTDLAGYKVFYRYLSESVDGTENGTTGYEPPGQTTTPGSPASSDATVTGTFSWNNTFTSTVPAVGLSTTAGTLNVTVLSAVKGKKTVVWTVTGLADDDDFTVAWTSSSANKYGAGSVSGTIGSTTYTTTSTPAQSGFSISGSIKATSQTKSTVAATPDITTDIPSTSEVAPAAQWINAGDTDQITMSLRDFAVASTIEFAVQAYDSSKLNYSVYSDGLTVETGSPAIILSPPSIPTAEARLGTITVKWDGYDDQGDVPPPYLAYTEVHLSTSSTFTPDSTTLKGRMERLGYNELVIANLVYGTTYYAKLVFVSTTGAATQASDPSTGVTVVALVNTDVIGKVLDGANIVSGSITASDAIIGNTITGDLIQSNTIEAGSIKTNSLTADQIQAGALDAFLITGANIRTSSGTGARIVLNSSGLTAYNSSNVSTFNISASTGALTLTGYVPTGGTAADINANTTKIEGGKIVTGSITADQIGSNAVTAAKILATDTFSYRNSASTQEVRIGGNALSDGNLTASTAFYLNSSYYGSTEAYYYAASGNYGMRFRSNFGGLAFLPPGFLGTTTALLYADDIWNQADAELILQSQSYARFVSSPKVSFEQTPLHIFGDGSKNMLIVWNDGNPYDSGSSSARLFYVNGAASETVINNGTTATTFNSFYVYGKIRATGTITGSSSRRWKTNITPVAADYRLLDIPTVTYQFDRHSMDPEVPEGELGELQIGMIAEDFIDAGLDLVVGYDNDGNVDGLDYSRIVTYLIPIVKELKQEIDSLKARLGD